METAGIRDVPIEASRIGIGTWAMGGYQWGGTDDDESVRTLHAAFDRGINLIDTAPAYGFGHAEEVVGRAVAERGNRDRVVIVTKVGLERRGNALFRNSTPKQLNAEIEDSLRRLRTDYIDLYLVHWPDPATPFEETATALLALQRAGKIRAIGVSNYDVRQMQRFETIAPIAGVQPPLNIFERGAQREILPWCQQRGVATLTYGALCRGMLTGALHHDTVFEGDDLRQQDPKFLTPRYEQYLRAVGELERIARDRYDKSVTAFAVRWVLDQPGVSAALWGARHPSELSPVDEVMSFQLDNETKAAVDHILQENVRDPVGPEFMAPPARPASATAGAGAGAARQ